MDDIRNIEHSLCVATASLLPWSSAVCDVPR